MQQAAKGSWSLPACFKTQRLIAADTSTGRKKEFWLPDRGKLPAADVRRVAAVYLHDQAFWSRRLSIVSSM